MPLTTRNARWLQNPPIETPEREAFHEWLRLELKKNRADLSVIVPAVTLTQSEMVAYWHQHRPQMARSLSRDRLMWGLAYYLECLRLPQPVLSEMERKHFLMFPEESGSDSAE